MVDNAKESIAHEFHLNAIVMVGGPLGMRLEQEHAENRRRDHSREKQFEGSLGCLSNAILAQERN